MYQAAHRSRSRSQLIRVPDNDQPKRLLMLRREITEWDEGFFFVVVWY